jgi:hypothetical protein
MASTVQPDPAARRPPRTAPWDLAGLVLVAALAGWTLVASSGRPRAEPLPVLALLGWSVALFAGARVAAHRHGDLVPRLVAYGIGGAFLFSYPGVVSSGGAPTDYGNTNGTLAGLGVITALVLVRSSRGAARRGWLALVAGLLVCVVLSESVAAGAALAVALVLGLVAMLRRDASVASLGGLLATWLAVGTTIALAAGAADPPGGDQQTLRVELWTRALDLARDAPLRGRGPGSFAPPIETFDLDLRWAHHEYLQLAAEAGVVGLVLLLALVAWLFAYLWWGRGRGLVRTVAGASAVTLVAVHAAVDHVLHTAVIPLTLAVVVGWATADPRGRGSPGSRPLPP